MPEEYIAHSAVCQKVAMSNSEKIKPVALAVIELCLTEGIRQAVSQKKILFNIFFTMAIF